MGILTKHLEPMEAVRFDGYAPDPEAKAMAAMEAWLAKHPEAAASHRVFGHNIDEDGHMTSGPEYAGYRVYVTVDPGVDVGSTPRTTIEGGTFLVSGIEGSFEDDPAGAWIGEGWSRMNETAKRSDVEIAEHPRWFEEVLDPTVPGNTRFDLYLEVADGE